LIVSSRVQGIERGLVSLGGACNPCPAESVFAEILRDGLARSAWGQSC